MMGFNLKIMFMDFIRILASGKSDSDKLNELEAAIYAAKKYARQCGHFL